MAKCFTLQQGDQTVCKTHGTEWDTNDVNPHNCSEMYKPTSLAGRIIDWNNDRYKEPQLEIVSRNLIKDLVGRLSSGNSKEYKLQVLADIVFAAIGAMHHQGISEEDIYRIVFAMCNSNDTRPIESLKPYVRCSKDKRDNYLCPIKEIKRILEDGK